MNYGHYFTPANFEILSFPIKKGSGALLDKVRFYIGEDDFDITEFDIAIIGVDGSDVRFVNDNEIDSSNAIRPFLYHLRLIEKLNIVDFGNILGESNSDKNFLLQEVITQLNLNGITAIVIGGSDDFCRAQCAAAKEFSPEERLKVTVIDSLIDSGDGELDSTNYLPSIIDIYTVDLTVLGVQNYYNSANQDFFVEKNFLDVFRLKDVRDTNIGLAEVPLRDSHVIALDISALTSSSMPASSKPRPNGFSALDVCQLAWYSGISSEVRSFGLYNIEVTYDINRQGVALAGQIIWHFIYGYANKKLQNSLKDVAGFQKFSVYLESYGVNIDFFCSLDGVRWWMEVIDNKTTAVVSCNKSDYYEALQGEVPKKWWRYFLRNQFLGKY